MGSSMVAWLGHLLLLAFCFTDSLGDTNGEQVNVFAESTFPRYALSSEILEAFLERQDGKIAFWRAIDALCAQNGSNSKEQAFSDEALVDILYDGYASQVRKSVELASVALRLYSPR